MEEHMYIKITGIIGTVAIVGMAISHGIDGVCIASGMAIVAGISGYEVGIHKRRK